MKNENKSPDQNNIELQEKSKKILMVHDKAKIDYTKKENPEYLKYNSDNSESSDQSGIKKTKKTKNENNNRNSVKIKNSDFSYDKKKSNQNTCYKNIEFIKSKSGKKISEEENSPNIKNKKEKNISKIEISRYDKKEKKTINNAAEAKDGRAT